MVDNVVVTEKDRKTFSPLELGKDRDGKQHQDRGCLANDFDLQQARWQTAELLSQLLSLLPVEVRG